MATIDAARSGLTPAAGTRSTPRRPRRGGSPRSTSSAATPSPGCCWSTSSAATTACCRSSTTTTRIAAMPTRSCPSSSSPSATPPADDAEAAGPAGAAGGLRARRLAVPRAPADRLRRLRPRRRLARAGPSCRARGVGGFLAESFQRNWFQTLVHIALTSLWVMPVIAAGPGAPARLAVGSAALHVWLSHAFFYEWAWRRPVIDGGQIGFLTWTVPAHRRARSPTTSWPHAAPAGRSGRWWRRRRS